MKHLYIVRGLPGAGKTTFAYTLTDYVAEADQYFSQIDEDGRVVYKYDPTKIAEAHESCQNKVRIFMKGEIEKICVSNTFTQEWEMTVYHKLAKEFGYQVHTLIVENYHGGKSVHNVPQETMNLMAERFDVVLY